MHSTDGGNFKLVEDGMMMANIKKSIPLKSEKEISLWANDYVVTYVVKKCWICNLNTPYKLTKATLNDEHIQSQWRLTKKLSLHKIDKFKEPVNI